MTALRRADRCIDDHLLAGRNLYIAPNGSRRCRTCLARKAREQRAATHPGRGRLVPARPQRPVLLGITPAQLAQAKAEYLLWLARTS